MKPTYSEKLDVCSSLKAGEGVIIIRDPDGTDYVSHQPFSQADLENNKIGMNWRDHILDMYRWIKRTKKDHEDETTTGR